MGDTSMELWRRLRHKARRLHRATTPRWSRNIAFSYPISAFSLARSWSPTSRSSSRRRLGALCVRSRRLRRNG